MINDGEKFEDIYSEELQPNKENSDNLEALYLDLQIKTENGKVIVDLLIKETSFPLVSFEAIQIQSFAI